MTGGSKSSIFSIRITEDLLSKIEQTSMLSGQSKASVVSTIVERFFAIGGNAQILLKYLLERGYRQLREIEEELGGTWIEPARESAGPLVSVKITEEEYRALKTFREGSEQFLEKEIDRETESRIDERRARKQKKKE